MTLLAMVGCGNNTPAIVDARVDATHGSEPLGPAFLTASPGSVEFATGSITTTVSVFLTVTNIGQTGSGPLVTSVSGTAAASFAVAGMPCPTLAAGAACTMWLEFAPSTVGEKTATLTLSANPGGLLTIPLAGTALSGPGGIYINPSSHSLGTVPTGTLSAPSTFTIVNSGNVSTGALTLTPVGSHPADFAKTNDTCSGVMLAPAASCSFAVQFAPTTTGARSAQIITSASPGGSATATVTGIGQ